MAQLSAILRGKFQRHLIKEKLARISVLNAKETILMKIDFSLIVKFFLDTFWTHLIYLKIYYVIFWFNKIFLGTSGMENVS